MSFVRAHRCRWIFALLASVPAALASAAEVPAPAGARAQESRDLGLVLLVAVDQLRRDRFDPALPGGLGRFAREGRVYTEAMLDHAVSETCPGHAVMLTGRHPGAVGIPSNHFVERNGVGSTYCVGDRNPDSLVIGGEDRAGRGRSPRLMRVDTLGSWMKAARPGTRVYSVSGKDRGAIASVGRGADVAYWYEDEDGFTTSHFYADELPAWVRQWNGREPTRDGLFRELPDTWDHQRGDPGPHGRVDDYHAESAERKRVSGHPIRDDDPATFAKNVYSSPFLDRLSLDFARELVAREGLGRGAAPDLLVLALSATDIVGHNYGPESHEARDALERLDEELGIFMTELEARVGKGRVLSVLTADHGVLPLPDWLQETGRSRCRLEGGRMGLRWPAIALGIRMHRQFAPLFSWPVAWLSSNGRGLMINRQAAAKHGVALEEVAAAAKGYLESYEGIERVWTRTEILEGQSEQARLYRNSFDPQRSPDLEVQVAPTCLISKRSYGTSHGSSHAYDRAVPLAFLGPGIAAAQVPGAAATVDIAPTLAAILGLELPDGLDGRVLFGAEPH
ncbi:MAG: alkaline phosphatase family protein [Deltaproteobacteria bacterium]|nr:alkaline phosphatase family protein [Deltaproteobacteria bacterium]